MDDEEGPWIAVYWRYGGEHKESFDTSREAWLQLHWGAADNNLAPKSIIDPDGNEHLYPYNGGDEAVWKLLETNSLLVERDGMKTLDGAQGLLDVVPPPEEPEPVVMKKTRYYAFCPEDSKFGRGSGLVGVTEAFATYGPTWPKYSDWIFFEIEEEVRYYEGGER